MNTTITQNKVDLIGKFKKIDALRYNTTGYAVMNFVTVIPEEKQKRDTEIPCVIYGKLAEEIDKKIKTGAIKDGGDIQVIGKLHIVFINKYPHLAVHVKTLESQENTNLFDTPIAIEIGGNYD